MPKPTRTKPMLESSGIAARLKALRREAGLSQEAIGAQGFVLAPGWIKVENGQRSPSEKLLAAFVAFLAAEKHIRAGQRAALTEELTTLKYTESKSSFLAQLARERLASLISATDK